MKHLEDNFKLDPFLKLQASKSHEEPAKAATNGSNGTNAKKSPNLALKAP